MTQFHKNNIITTPKEKFSPWVCYLFGTYGKKTQIILNCFIIGEEPNWFWRLMQFLLLGNKWIKEKS